MKRLKPLARWHQQQTAVEQREQLTGLDAAKIMSLDSSTLLIADGERL